MTTVLHFNVVDIAKQLGVANKPIPKGVWYTRVRLKTQRLQGQAPFTVTAGRTSKVYGSHFNESEPKGAA